MNRRILGWLARPLWLAFGASCLLLLAGPILAATLVASVDRAEAYLGDQPLVLTLTVDDANFDGNPELQPLVTDFEVLGRPTLMSSSAYVNGNLTSSKAWEITLRPRRPGDLTIPALTVGSLTSQPLNVLIKQAPTNAVNNPDLQIRVEVDTDAPYVQQQVLYTLNILNAKPLSRDTEPRLEWPAGLVAQRMPAQPPTWTQVGNRTFKVRKITYALFPERSEQLTIPGPRYAAWISDGNSRSPFARGKRVDVIGETVVLDVKPQASAYSGDAWFPAINVELSEEWPQNIDFSFKVGEPVTWLLRLKARGQLSTQLPEIIIDSIDGARIYPDQARREDGVDSDWIGQNEARFAVVPDRAGRLTLPEVRLSWWDTRADQQREAVIPSRQVTVAPSALAGNEPLPSAPESATTGDAELAATMGQGSGFWRGLALIALALWVATLIAWMVVARQGRRALLSETKPSANPTALAVDSKVLQQACQSNDAARAAQAVLAQARQSKPNVGALTLSRLAQMLDNPTAATALLELDQALYSQRGQAWSGDVLWQALNRGWKWHKPAAARAKQSVVLPELYSKRS